MNARPAAEPTSAPRRPRGRPPATDARDTRDVLLTTALELFARDGYATTSVRAIAAAAGLSDAGLYAHFPSKQALYDELFAQAGPISLETLGLQPDELAEQPPRTALHHLRRELFAYWETDRARAFNGLLRHHRGTDDGLVDAITHARQRLTPLFTTWITAGRVRSDIAPEQMVWELFTPLATIRALYLHQPARPDRTTEARKLGERHIEFFLDAVDVSRDGGPMP